MSSRLSLVVRSASSTSTKVSRKEELVARDWQIGLIGVEFVLNSDRSRIRFDHDDTDECVYKRDRVVSFALHSKDTELSALVRTRTWCAFLNAMRVCSSWSI